MDTDCRVRQELYREIANELRLLIPKLKDAEAAGELSLLVAQYERLAEHDAQAAPYLLRHSRELSDD